MGKLARRALRRRGEQGDEGGALILVLVIAVLLVATLGVAVAVTTSGLQFTTMFKDSSQSEMAAQSGLASMLTSIEQVTTYGALPCAGSGSLGVPGATSTYSTTVSYSVYGTPLACTGSDNTLGGSTTPTNATLTSAGKAPHGATVTMKEDIEIAANPSTEAQTGYAIYTANNVVLNNDIQLTNGTAAPDVYAGQQVTCKNGTLSSGSLVTYQPVDLSGSCTFQGNVTSAGYVELQNSAQVDGSIYSFGGNTAATSCGSTKSGGVYTYYDICLSGSALVKGSVSEMNANIEVTDGTVQGDAYAAGQIYVTGGGTITGTSTPNDTSLASQTMQPASTFPSFSLPSTGWNVVDIPNSSYTCAQYFQSINNEAGSTSPPSIAYPDPFQAALETQTTPTIYDAPSCDVSYQNAQVFGLNPTGGNAILDVAQITFSNSNIFCEESAESSGICSTATSPGPNFVIEANGPPPPPPATSYTCSTSTVDMTFNNATDFESNLDVLLYSMGEISYANDAAMTGQIQACGGLIGSNSFQLSFDPSAAEMVYSTPASGITISVIDKYVASG